MQNNRGRGVYMDVLGFNLHGGLTFTENHSLLHGLREGKKGRDKWDSILGLWPKKTLLTLSEIIIDSQLSSDIID